MQVSSQAPTPPAPKAKDASPTPRARIVWVSIQTMGASLRKPKTGDEDPAQELGVLPGVYGLSEPDKAVGLQSFRTLAPRALYTG